MERNCNVQSSGQSGFYIAPFGIDGEQAGFGFWATSKLSEAWLGVCREFMKIHGLVFDAGWGGKLSEVRTKFSSVSGAALATFFVRNQIASSLLILSGQTPEVERTVTEMFVESLNKTAWVDNAASTSHPFSNIAEITDRPLLVAVAWPVERISDDEHNIVRELGLHLAGAYLYSGF